MEKLYTKVKKDKRDTVVSYLEKNYGRYGFPATYYDKVCLRKECSAGHQRSLDALYQVCLSRFPKLTIDKFFRSLIAFMRKNKSSSSGYAMLFCPSVGKWVVHSLSGGDYNLYHKGLVYDYGNSRNKLNNYGSGELRAKEIIDIANATT